MNDFDFWVGTWEGTWENDDGPGAATNTITKELNGHVVVERFATMPAVDFNGLSVTVYDEREGCWKQTWVDDTGAYLDFRGGRVADDVILTRQFVVERSVVTQRMVFCEIEPDRFTWLWQRARAAGDWETLWRIDYARQ
ncbi:MAG TPA: DUF1579 family protein [Gaiellaceae bacterium]|nr:DUF1579 family protein [Gaiellaceae bacterium]